MVRGRSGYVPLMTSKTWTIETGVWKTREHFYCKQSRLASGSSGSRLTVAAGFAPGLAATMGTAKEAELHSCKCKQGFLHKFRQNVCSFIASKLWVKLSTLADESVGWQWQQLRCGHWQSSSGRTSDNGKKKRCCQSIKHSPSARKQVLGGSVVKADEATLKLWETAWFDSCTKANLTNPCSALKNAIVFCLKNLKLCEQLNDRKQFASQTPCALEVDKLMMFCNWTKVSGSCSFCS